MAGSVSPKMTFTNGAPNTGLYREPTFYKTDRWRGFFCMEYEGRIYRHDWTLGSDDINDPRAYLRKFRECLDWAERTLAKKESEDAPTHP